MSERLLCGGGVFIMQYLRREGSKSAEADDVILPISYFKIGPVVDGKLPEGKGGHVTGIEEMVNGDIAKFS